MELFKISDTEYRAGNSKIYLLDKNIVVSEPEGQHGLNEAKMLHEATNKIKEKIEGSIFILVDLSKATKSSPEARKFWEEVGKDPQIKKVAFWGLNPVARVVAAFEIGISERKNKMRFFSSKEKALLWFEDQG